MTQEQADKGKTDLDGGEARLAMEASAAAAGARAVPSLGAARRRWGEALIKALLILAALISVLTTTGIVIALLRETIDFFGEVGVWEFLLGTKWTPLFEPASFGVRPLVIGTFLITGVALLVAVAARPRRRDLPVASTPSRACARRSSRSSSCSPACRRSCSATSR